MEMTMYDKLILPPITVNNIPHGIDKINLYLGAKMQYSENCYLSHTILKCFPWIVKYKKKD